MERTASRTGVSVVGYFVIPSEAGNPDLCWCVQKLRSLTSFGMTKAVFQECQKQPATGVSVLENHLGDRLLFRVRNRERCVLDAKLRGEFSCFAVEGHSRTP